MHHGLKNRGFSGFNCGCSMGLVKRAGRGKGKILKSVCLVSNEERGFTKRGGRKKTKLEKERKRT